MVHSDGQGVFYMRTKTKKKKGLTAYKPEMVIQAYEFAKSGMTQTRIAKALGISRGSLLAWMETNPELAYALRAGRKCGKQGPDYTFRDYVYNRLPPELKNLWNAINRFEQEDNGIQKIEAMLQDKGKKVRQHLFLYALTSSNFNMAQACRRLNISRRTLTEWQLTDPDFSTLMKEIDAYKGDFFENALLKQVKAGNHHCIIFANKTYNKDRGYGEKPAEVNVNYNGDTNISLNVVNVDDLNLPLSMRMNLLKCIRDARIVAEEDVLKKQLEVA